MNIRKTFKFVFKMLSIIIFALIVSTLLASNIFAKYLTGESSDDDARVAKWNISFSDDTEKFNSIISSTHLEAGSKGEWGLDIANKSEVAAIFSEDSNIKIRLQSPDFHIEHEHNSWDFLVDENHNHIDNPINFKAVMYNCSITELNSAIANNTIGNIEAIEIFNTSTNADEQLPFKMIIDNGEVYFECVVDVGEKLDNDKFFLDSGTGKACLKIFWEVDKDKVEGAVSTNVSFRSFHLVKKSEYDSEYDHTKNPILQETDTSGNVKDVIVTIDSVQYVIACKTYDYFEYLIYTSSLGGEIMITCTDTDNKKEYIRRCTKLSDAEKTELINRDLTNPTIKSVEKYIEKLEYEEFNKFLKIKKEYSLVTGYLGLGLECRIVLNIKIEQVD